MMMNCEEKGNKKKRNKEIYLYEFGVQIRVQEFR